MTGWISFAFAIGGVAALAWILWRGQTGAALGYLTQANQVLHRQIEDLTVRVADQEKIIGVLENKTDVSIALQPLVEWMQKQDRALEHHEERAAERTKRTLAVLDLIAERLGPEPNGNGPSYKPGPPS